MDESLLSIGELAAHSGLSPKALRLYDESGLLVPRRVDPSTGYRSYGTDQVGRARLIAALRGLGMGLARIRVLCDLDGAAAATELRSWWRQEEADALSRAVAVRHLASSLGQHPTEDAMTTTTTPARSASALHIGLERTAQEDAVLVRDLPVGRSLLAAADGFGGAGDLAARMLAAFADALERALAAPSAAPLHALETAWTAAEALEPTQGESGSTLTAAVLDGDRLHIAHLGDTRAMLVRAGRLEHVTQDHTHVRSLLEAGRLSPEEALPSGPTRAEPGSRRGRPVGPGPAGAAAGARRPGARGLGRAACGRRPVGPRRIAHRRRGGGSRRPGRAPDRPRARRRRPRQRGRGTGSGVNRPQRAARTTRTMPRTTAPTITTRPVTSSAAPPDPSSEHEIPA